MNRVERSSPPNPQAVTRHTGSVTTASSTPDDVRASRLVLAQLTSRVLSLGLRLLGIETPERL
ncbi:MAG: hypothetical protein GEV04_25340 [Actinophytocola sp.]|nr:hypothetical protein [Actinophytocola sp.]